jgi:hypothetical protein
MTILKNLNRIKFQYARALRTGLRPGLMASMPTKGRLGDPANERAGLRPADRPADRRPVLLGLGLRGPEEATERRPGLDAGLSTC